MNKRLLLNLLMLITLLGLVALTVYKPGIDAPTENAPLTTLDSEQINHIDISRAGGAVNLERRDNGWWVTNDIPVPADQNQVDILLNLASLSPVRSYPSTEFDPTQLHLEPALATLRLNDTELRFGDTETLDNLRYVRVGDRISLISDNYQNLLQGTRTQFASRKLLSDTAAIVGITLPNLKLTKPEGGTWLIEPEPERISADAAPKLVEAWATASALWVRNYQPSENSTPVSIDLADGQHIEFRLRQNDRETVLARPDLGLEYNLVGYSAKALFELEQPAKESAAEPAPAETSE